MRYPFFASWYPQNSPENDRYRIRTGLESELVELQVVIEPADLDALGITRTFLGHLRDGLTGQAKIPAPRRGLAKRYIPSSLKKKLKDGSDNRPNATPRPAPL